MVTTKSVNEVWVSVPEYEGLYEASTFGNVRSARRVIPLSNGGTCIREGRTLVQSTKSNGYLQVTLVSANGRRESVMVHRIILLSFRGVPSEGMVSRHLDGVRSNNYLTNLKWGTYSENNGKDRILHGTHLHGEQCTNAKLTEDDVRTMRTLRNTGMTVGEIATQFPQVAHDSIYSILNGRTWKHVIV